MKPEPQESAVARAVRLRLDRVPPKVAAQLLGISPRQLRTWVMQGYGPPRTTLSKRKHVYDVRDIQSWLEGRAKASVTTCPTCGAPISKHLDADN